MSSMKVDGLNVGGEQTIQVPDFPSNSHKSNESQLPAKIKVRPIPKERQQNKAKTVFDDIFKGSIPEARKTIWENQIKPGLLDMGANALYTLVDYIFYQGGRCGRRGPGRRTNYRAESERRSKSGRDDEYGESDRPMRKKWNQVIISKSTMSESRQKADEIWNTLVDNLEENNQVSVGDLFSAAELPTVYTDFDYGWRTLEGCDVKSVGNGYWFDMTKPVKLDA